MQAKKKKIQAQKRENLQNNKYSDFRQKFPSAQFDDSCGCALLSRI